MKLIQANAVKKGVNLIFEDEPFVVESVEISKPGRHGHAKVRMAMKNLETGKKKEVVVPGHEKFNVPMIEKRSGQVLSVGNKISVMDSESFETIELNCPDEEKSKIKENEQVEYWVVEGKKIIKF